MATESYSDSQKLRFEAVDMINAVRKNHALEHATINLLMKRREGKIKLIGRAGLNGFYIYGNIPTEVLEDTAREALQRLQRGEEELAISHMCGTNLVVAGLAAGMASMVAGRGHRGLGKFIRVCEASIAAVLVAQPLARLAQKHITTTPDLDNVRIIRVVKTGKGKITRHKVEVAHR